MIKECFSGHLVHSLAFPTSPTSMLISDANPSQGATQPPEDRRMAQRVLCANDAVVWRARGKQSYLNAYHGGGPPLNVMT